MERITVYLNGIVQGVGMRHTVYTTAHGLDIKGYVMNLHDGRVKIVAEGKEDNLSNLISFLKESKVGNITKIDIKKENYTGEFDSFQVRF